MLPAGIMDGILACTALILILTQYFGKKKSLNRQLQIGIEQNRCAMACQGCGAAFYFF